jgi:hypothetical protein
MKIVMRVILLAALLALGFWLWTIFFPSPEKIIRKQLLNLADHVSFTRDQSDLVKLAHAQSVVSFFTTGVVINVTGPDHGQMITMSYDEITPAALALRQHATDATVKFPDIDVTVAPDKTSATAEVTVDATISGEADAIIQEVKFTFEKDDGHWLINRAETVPVITK